MEKPPFVARGAALAFVPLALSLAGCGHVTYPDPAPDLKLAATIREGGGGGQAGEATAAASTGTGWGTLKGVFVFEGQPETLAALLTGGKDEAVCGVQVPNESLVVDASTKGIANVVVMARRVSRKFDGGQPPPAEAVFDQKHCIFLSHVLGMQTSQKLLVKNSDPIAHNTNMSAPGNPSMNPQIGGGGTYEFQFKRALNAPVDVACNIHPWMKAFILARDDPYFAVTNAQGQFEIPNLPAGEEIEFQVWHERGAASGKGLAVAKPGWSNGRFKMKIPADGVADLGTIQAPAAAFQ